ncbi:MAG: YdcF family protein [Pedosphaera sp.]|nr:YdcF family protein [Pedosphaera sp.]
MRPCERMTMLASGAGHSPDASPPVKPAADTGMASNPLSVPSAQSSIARHSSHELWGMVTRKERWGLSRRGWLWTASLVLVSLVLVLFTVYPFLAVTHRVDTDILVVEGWIHKYAIRAGAEEFTSGSYQRVYATGGPVVGNGGYVNDYQTSASVGAELLQRAGIPSESLQMVPSHEMGRDRTYSSAIALRDWFRDNKVPVRNFNIVTEDAHARRTRLLFQKAFGDGVVIGIISVPSSDYDARHWWRYSDGVREVVGETIAYIYARVFFWP